MRTFYAIAGLRNKRARLAGEIEAAERAIVRQREDLAAIDATLRLFSPDADPNHITSIRPLTRNTFFRRGEMSRYCLEALRDAGKPLPISLIADYVMRAKGVTRDDKDVWTAARDNLRVVMARHEARGNVRKILSGPEAWWELVR
jgi:hypothetical protein